VSTEDADASMLARAHSPTAFWLVNAFSVLISLLLIGMLEKELAVVRMPIALILVVFWFIFNLYYLVLPRLLVHVDKVILLAVTQLCYIGIAIQIRLSLLTPSVLKKAVEVNQGDVVAAALRLISPQMISLAIGLVILPLVTLIVAKTRFLEVIFPVCVVLTPLLLAVTLVFGRGDQTHGATLWINLGGMSLQLTEFAKITYLIVLAQFFKNRPLLKTQFAFAIWAGIVFFLIMLLPDLGSLMILLPVTLVVFLVMTSEYLTTLMILGGGVALGTVAFTLFPHVRSRLAGWTTLWEEVNDSNRQIVYGLQAMARGGLFGRGLGNGSPEGIPVVASDMVFTILCEEMGLLIGICVVVFFIIIWLRAARSMPLVKDGFSSSMTLAVASLFFFEAVIVIAGCTGLIPLTGVTLPFISQGGSSLLAKMILVGILLGLMSRRNELEVML
jgi:cell division protein FtsW (lipid II flippase)